MPRRLDLVLAACAIALLAAGAAHAQASERDPLTVGVEAGPTSHNQAYGAGFVRIRHTDRFVTTARLSVVELERGVRTGLLGSEQDKAVELAVLAGYSRPLVGRVHVTAGVGVSALRVTRYTAQCTSTFLGCWPTGATAEATPVLVGLPVEVGVHTPVRGAFGVGLRAFASVNVEESFGGLSVSLLLNPARRVPR